MIILIIEIDGYYHQVLLIGKMCSKRQLQQKYRKAKYLTCNTKELPNVLCELYNFDQIPYNSNAKADFVIDTDTDRIYSPFY